MTKNIGTDANIDQVRLKQETAHPASPASGYELLYIISGSAHGGLYVKDSSGRQIGPFITGTLAASGAPSTAHYVLTSGSGGTLSNSHVIPYYANYNPSVPPTVASSNNDEFDDDVIAPEWTQVGSPDTISESTYHGYLYVQDNESTPAGVRKAYAPAGGTAFTVVAKLGGYLAAGFSNVILAVETSVPADIALVGVQNNNAGFIRYRSKNGASETNPAFIGSSYNGEFYLMLQRDAASNYFLRHSTNGINFYQISTFNNSGTVANVAILMDSQGAGSTNSDISVDFIRFFSSVTTVIGSAPSP